ncbi:FUSC family protein [Acidomonas methanolica]|uniref:FUSC family protein n=1 Tax=Acidomonas methanolica TaxID=437 RepID=UPI0010DD183F|nr:FUSC family protein [Acidomonas methanolica]MBU2654402.1 FUSC family protein [Acidomonas methanolica]TCS28491.1 putative membrane protein YccC [Acidomonas methanolica]
MSARIVSTGRSALRALAAEWPLAWLWNPDMSALLFAVRNTIASLVALWIAFAMELSEPQWAAMTVWIVAQGSRGESLSKGRWRIVGTAAGMVAAILIIACFPQQPWLFLPALAIWAGLCAGLATLVQNFRSYAFVLAAYTGAIIAMDSSAHPGTVFSVAMDRGTYIVIGVICEMVAGLLFAAGLDARARRFMRAELLSAIASATATLADILRGSTPPENDVRAVFSRTLALNDQMEFIAVEIGRRDRQVVCAYETIGLISRLMSRALGMRARLRAVPDRSALSEEVIGAAATLLEGMAARLADPAEVAGVRAEIDAQAELCHRAEARTIAVENAAEGDEAGREQAIRDRVALQGLAFLLREYQRLLTCFAADPAALAAPGRYRLKALPNWRAAWHNGVRATAAILIAGMVWEMTAWTNGAVFVSLVAVVCGRFAAVENTVLASNRFFYGACWAVLASIVPVFFLIPLADGFGALTLAIAPFMLLGGLALRNPATQSQAASYSMFFPVMLGLGNATKMADLTWFNTAVTLLLSLGGGVLVFKCVLPFDEYRVCMVMRRRTLGGLRRILRGGRHAPDDADWVGMITQSMQRLIRYAGLQVTPVFDTYLGGALAVMTMGRNLLALRARSVALPPEARAEIETMMARLCGSGVTLGHLREEVARVLGVLRRMEHDDTGEEQRSDLTQALGSLLIVSVELDRNEAFLDDRLFANAMLRRA